ARTEAGGCGCNAGAADQAVVEEAQAVVDAAAVDEDLAELDEDLAALVAAVAVAEDPSDEDLATVERDMKAIVAAAAPAPVEGDAAAADGDAGTVTAAGKNWVQQTGTGHLPAYVRRIADHLKKKGMDESRAIATAVNVVKKACANPDGLNFPGVQKVTGKTRAQACQAVAQWEAKKAEARMK
ncbi:hypothetical protein ACIBPC_31495, partial [Streptomyces sp. NPDC049879]